MNHLNKLYRKEVRRKMSRLATKAAESEFYRARMEASAANDSYKSREGAAEVIGMDRTRLARIELGTVFPYPEEVVMMADAYNAPELMNHYCSSVCPIGRRIVPHAELNQLDRMTIRIMNALDGVQGIGKDMREIADDGTIRPEEVPRLKEIYQALHKVATVTAEMQIWMEKYAKGDGLPCHSRRG